MSALDRAWRQGRLGPFKGSDMPLGGAFQNGNVDPTSGSRVRVRVQGPGSRVRVRVRVQGPTRQGPTRQGPTRRPEGSSSKALLDGRTGPARRRERWRTPRRFGQVRTWSSSQPRPVLRMPPGMSALDRAWRQGRLGPFKGSDMPLGRRHVSPGPGLAPRAPRPVQGLRHAFGRSLPERERGSDVRVHGPGSGSGSRVQGPGSRSGSRVQGPRSRVQGPGSRVQGPG